MSNAALISVKYMIVLLLRARAAKALRLEIPVIVSTFPPLVPTQQQQQPQAQTPPAYPSAPDASPSMSTSEC